MAKVTYKCEDPTCIYPDVVEYDPMDDNLICPCGLIKWGRWYHQEDMEKKKFWEEETFRTD
jgi:hypothetical protein